jgi:hypothetical protein
MAATSTTASSWTRASRRSPRRRGLQLAQHRAPGCGRHDQAAAEARLHAAHPAGEHGVAGGLRCVSDHRRRRFHRQATCGCGWPSAGIGGGPRIPLDSADDDRLSCRCSRGALRLPPGRRQPPAGPSASSGRQCRTSPACVQAAGRTATRPDILFAPPPRPRATTPMARASVRPSRCWITPATMAPAHVFRLTNVFGKWSAQLQLGGGHLLPQHRARPADPDQRPSAPRCAWSMSTTWSSRFCFIATAQRWCHGACMTAGRSTRPPWAKWLR